MRAIKNVIHNILTKIGITWAKYTLPQDTASTRCIPLPHHIECSSGRFGLDAIRIFIEDSNDITSKTAVINIKSIIQKQSGVDCLFVDKKEKANLVYSKESHFEDTQYELVVESSGIIVQSGNQTALQYALYTLAGLIEIDSADTFKIPYVKIKDKASYAWRGLHIDVARHMMPHVFLYSLIENMAFYKLNTLHLHLTDDQGWRFESLRHPKLHHIGGYRTETVIDKYFVPFSQIYIGDKTRYGGYYTQSDLRALDSFARDRGVTIVPEIDLPGHSTAALVAYPEHAAGSAPKKTATSWGVFDNVFSPKPPTIQFLVDVIDEVGSVFSSPYIHIGGDEVATTKYQADLYTQAHIKSEDMSDYKNVPDYILGKLAEHLTLHNKKSVVWDEAAEIALMHGGATMIWRDNTYAQKILAKGGTVIMCPSSHMYFDYYQKAAISEPLAIGGFLPLENVYTYKAPKSSKGTVLGIQANLWTEYIKSPEQAEYMLYPRLYALAEVAWGSNNNVSHFLSRVENVTQKSSVSI